MICARCGHELADDANFCDECGLPVAVAIPRSEPPQSLPAAETSGPPIAALPPPAQAMPTTPLFPPLASWVTLAGGIAGIAGTYQPWIIGISPDYTAELSGWDHNDGTMAWIVCILAAIGYLALLVAALAQPRTVRIAAAVVSLLACGLCLAAGIAAYIDAEPFALPIIRFERGIGPAIVAAGGLAALVGAIATLAFARRAVTTDRTGAPAA
jgi:hypothetical protein